MKRIHETKAVMFLEEYRSLCMKTGLALSIDEGAMIVAEATREAIGEQYKSIRAEHVVASEMTPAKPEKVPEPVAKLPTPKKKGKAEEVKA